MNDKKTAKTDKKAKTGGTGIKDLAPRRDPKGGELQTPTRPDSLPRGGWDGNHNVAF